MKRSTGIPKTVLVTRQGAQPLNPRFVNITTVVRLSVDTGPAPVTVSDPCRVHRHR
jgi:hypothetical protein